MNIKKGQLEIINTILTKLGAPEDGSNIDTLLAYGIAKNQFRMKEEVESLAAIRKDIEMNEERVIICEKYSKKDEDGNVMHKTLENGNQAYDIDVDNTEFNDEMRELGEKQQKKLKEVAHIFDEESEVEFYKMSISVFPKSINIQEMQILFPIIEDPEES